MVLAREQQTTLKSLITRLFDKSLEGLRLTKDKIEDLRRRHQWYHSNIYQLHQLKEKISSIQKEYDQRIDHILHEIRDEKERTKQILYNALNRLETTIDKNLLKTYLDELIDECDILFNTTSALVLLDAIFRTIGLVSLIACIIAIAGGSATATVGSLGLALAAGGVTNEYVFMSKLKELEKKLADNIETVQNQKIQQSQQLDSYFDDFVRNLRYSNHPNSSTVDIVWFDKNIGSDANQSFAKRLLQEFSSGKYRMVQFADEIATIQFIQTNIENNIILITSGSAGETVIGTVGHYWNLKGIITYCIRVDTHRTWAGRYKKLLLVTNKDNEVIEKIKHIEYGDVYFIINGFTFDDVRLKLTDLDYYFSTNNPRFLIRDFQSINADQSYHRKLMEQFHEKILAKNIFPNGIPIYLQLPNLYRFVDEFLQTLKETEPEKALITLYTKDAPYYYKIINGILNRLDEELIELMGDYIKALRYALIIYTDASNRIPEKTEVKLYRGLHLIDRNSLEEFQRKFRVADVMIFPSFVSTSLDKEMATFFIKGRGILLEISTDCTQMTKPKHIAAASVYENEGEVLLNCFQLLKVMNIVRMSDDVLLYQCTLKCHLSN